MLRRSRPVAALCAVVLLSALTACGSDPEEGTADEAGSATGELSEVSFTGEVGEGLTAEWSAAVEQPEETRVETLVAGDGEEIAEGDTVTAYLYVGNGSTQEDVFSDYDNGAPESIPNDEQVGEVFLEMMDGATYGSRVVAVTTPTDLLGESAESNSLGLGLDDSVVVVMDLVEKQETSPTPSSDEAEDASPDSQPTVESKGGDPVGLDFSGLEEPALDAPVQRLVIEEGDGDPVTTSDTVTVDYLGAVYDADAPFDESYSRGEPLVSPLSGLIPGWSIGLDGVPVGSRVLLQIPPAYGYGTQGSPPNIPGNATLWFLIDVVAAE